MDLFDDIPAGDDDEDDALTGSADNDRFLGLGSPDQQGVVTAFGNGQDEESGRFLVGPGEGEDSLLGFGDGESDVMLRALEAAELGGVNLLFADRDNDAGDDERPANDNVDGGGFRGADSFPFSLDEGGMMTGLAANDLVDFNGIIDVTAFDDLDLANADDGASLTLAGDEALTFERIAAADLAAESFIFAEDGGIVIVDAQADDRLDGTDADDRLTDDLAGGDFSGFEAFDFQASDSSGLLALASGGTLDRDDFGLSGGDDAGSQPGSDGGDPFFGFQQAPLLDVSAAGLAGFDALDLQDDDGGVLTADDAIDLAPEDANAGDLDPFDFLLDT